ncbi:unnamed protein product [Aphanomyces euteiches]|uniref:FAD-binding PCMH-type domain-containing protein n=1 Tax=Aphanomyces euteiches TaxID=100861 RepID=A0A6G0XDG4_9STRA|nr:hypothetical protein Ae201684_006180 [Aphanomyces euteiches]KAH9068969.1 hypothetical protein Ae201684P_004666 [Aphanomyces euteiches]
MHRGGVVLSLALALVSADVWSNWDTRQVCHPHIHIRPSTAAELQQAVKDATRVRIAGAGHSFSPIVLTDDTLITLEDYTDVVAFTNDTITVQAGRPLYAINDYLAGKGRALPNLGAVAVHTAAGVTQTGTHGTGNTQCLSANIVGMDLVLANGTLKSLAADEPLFDAARVGMGVMGAVSTLTFRHVPLWTMEQITFTLPLDTFRQYRAALLNTFERTQWYMNGLPSDSSVTVVLRVNTTAPITTGCWSNQFSSTPVTPVPLGWAAWPAATKACVDASYKVLGREGKNNTNIFTEMEMMLPVDKDVAALDDMLALHASVADQHDPQVPLFLGFRYVQGDSIWLSPFYERDTVVVSTIVYHHGNYEPEIERYHRGMQSTLAKYAARPHPGKVNYFTRDEMTKVYPKLDAFVALQRGLDPSGKFLNDYTRRLLISGAESTELATSTATVASFPVMQVLGVFVLVAIVSTAQNYRRREAYQQI